MRPEPDPHTSRHHRTGGLAHDLDRLLLQRRRALRWLGAGAAAGAAPLALLGCGGGGGDAGSTLVTGSTGSTGSSGSGSGASGSCSVIPVETAGPYPADGSLASNQRMNALALSGIVRADIRSSVGTASGTAAGVPLTVVLKLVNTNSSCASLAGRAVYLWHCTRDGQYSLYSSSVVGENYLRGVQVSDDSGTVSFTTIFPGCYAGRWPHIHFEVYPSLAVATDAATVADYTTVSQLALPATACEQVYGVVSGYSASVANFAAISLASDNVFGNDSAASQMPTVSGDASSGFVATLQVGVAA